MQRHLRGLGMLMTVVAAWGGFYTLARGAVLPQKMFAVSQSQPGGVPEVAGAPSDSILFYDVTQIGNGATSGVFNNDPLFSVWVGYEIFLGEQNDTPDGLPIGNREDFSGITFNPANGTIYGIAFDSDSPLATDGVGDRMGDFDLYRIDYQAILKDFVDNARPRGTIYAPEVLKIMTVDEQHLDDIDSPLFDGTVDGNAHNVPHPSLGNTVHLPGSFEKIGQVGRSQTPASFFDHQLSFVNPETLILLDANTGTGTPATDDFSIRVLDRVSTSPGAATPPPLALPPPPTQEGGFNGASTESWNSWIAGRLELDPMAISSPAGWALVNHDGVLGIWAADGDGGGDDIAFYELTLDAENSTATKKELFTSPSGGPYPTQVGLAEDPSVDPASNDGESDYLFVDKNGNLVVIESGFFDPNPDPMAQTGADFDEPPDMMGDPAFEPRVITIDIADYDGPDSDTSGLDEVVPAGPSGTGFNDTAPYEVTGYLPISGANDNDTEVTNTTRAAFDKSTGYIYIIDQDIFDPGTGTVFHEDIYVFDPATGTIVYHEFTPFDIGLFNEGTQIVFTRGDIDGSGMVDYKDILTLKDAIADPTLGGTVTAALGAEWYDLTGDLALTAADLTELVEGILDTALGDFDLDGDVDGRDFLTWQRGQGMFDGTDLDDWQANYGFNNMLPAATLGVPEPGTMALCVLALVIGTTSARRRS